MPGSDTPHTAQPHNKLLFKLHFSGFVPEDFLTAQNTELIWKQSQTFPKRWFCPILSSSCHICSYKGFHQFYPKGWIPFWTKHKWKSGIKTPAYTGKKWGNGCLRDINLLFETSHWEKSSKGFTLHQELHFWKKYDGLMGKECISNAAC